MCIIDFETEEVATITIPDELPAKVTVHLENYFPDFSLTIPSSGDVEGFIPNNLYLLAKYTYTYDEYVDVEKNIDRCKDVLAQDEIEYPYTPTPYVCPFDESPPVSLGAYQSAFVWFKNINGNGLYENLAYAVAGTDPEDMKDVTLSLPPSYVPFEFNFTTIADGLNGGPFVPDIYVTRLSFKNITLYTYPAVPSGQENKAFNRCPNAVKSFIDASEV
eukprot:Awhi_evm1s340